MEQIILDVVSDPTADNVLALYDKISSDEEDCDMERYADMLHAMHYAIWDLGLNEVCKPKGNSLCLSMLTFVCCAYSYDATSDVDNNATLDNFPLIKIQPQWNHGKDLGAIRCMSLKLACDTLEAVEWSIFSDLTFGCLKRTEEWLTQVKTLLKLLRNRIYYFVQTSLSHEVLNIKHYVSVEKILRDPNLVDCGDYDSDEEIGRAKKACYRKVPEEVSAAYVFVNSDFIFDMDTYFSSIYSRFNAYERILPLTEAPQVCINRFRCWIFQEVKTITAKYVVAAREKWYLTLILSTCYTRIEFRKSMLGTAGLKQVIYKKNGDLPDSMPKTIMELETPAVQSRNEIMHVNTDALFMHLSAERGICRNIYVTDIPEFSKEGDLLIYFCPIPSIWVCQVSPTIKFKCDSLTRAFIVLRHYMRTNNVSNFVKMVDISIYDQHIFEA